MPVNPTQVYPAHFKPPWLFKATYCGNFKAIRTTDDPKLVTCKRCLKAMKAAQREVRL